MAVTELLADVVRVKNVDDKVFEQKCLGIPVRLEPGEERLLPRDGVMAWVGDGRHQNFPDKGFNIRQDCYEHIRLWFGTLHDEEKWQEVRPHLEVSTITGDPVPTIIDDPDGKGLTSEGKPDDTSMLKQLYEKQQVEMETLRKMIEASDKSPDDAEVAEDKPKQVPTGAARGRNA